MNMGSQDNKQNKLFWSSFRYAFAGILTAIKEETNMRFHIISSVLVITASVYFSISKTEWLFILFAIGGMFALELMNSAVERVVDLATLEYHPLAKQAKDLAAGAVFVYAILSVVAGIVIFMPYIVKILTSL